MKHINKIELTGYLVADAKIKTFNNNTQVEFRLARNESYLKNGNTIKLTMYYNVDVVCTLNNSIISRLKKGTPVFVIGDPRTYLKSDAMGMKKEGFVIKAFNIYIME